MMVSRAVPECSSGMQFMAHNCPRAATLDLYQYSQSGVDPKKYETAGTSGSEPRFAQLKPRFPIERKNGQD
jgi:hypothetical protein